MKSLVGFPSRCQCSDHNFKNKVMKLFAKMILILALLEGSPAITSTRSMKEKLRSEYALLLAPGGIISSHPHLFPGADPSLLGDGPFSFSNFEWAFTMLFSRAIRSVMLVSPVALDGLP